MASELLLQTLQHLSKAATIVDGDNRTNKLLNCYYLSRIRSIAATENVSVETSSHFTCRKCVTSLRDGEHFTLSIKSRKVRKAKYKKLVTNSECKDRNDNKFKKKLGRKYSRLVYNVAEITCKVCNSKSRSNIRFESKDKLKPKPLVEPPTVQLSDLELVNPKKRKRDKNAGLILKDIASGSKHLPPSQPKVIQPKVSQPKVIQPKTKLPLATPKSNTAKKAKNFPIEKKAKNVSTAQKQRKGILLLANVLKMNEQKQQNGSQSMLSKMFK